MTSELPSNLPALLHPLDLRVVDFREEDFDYHFRAEVPEPRCCEVCGTIGKLVAPKPKKRSPFMSDTTFGDIAWGPASTEDLPLNYGVPISTVLELVESGEI